MNNLQKMHLQLNSLTIFRNILNSPIISKLEKLLSNMSDSSLAVSFYSDFVSELYHTTDNLSDYIYHLVLEDENFYIKSKSKGQLFDNVVEKSLENELLILQQLSELKSSDVKSSINYLEFLPDWNISKYDFVSSYRERLANVSKHGFGVFAKYHMFYALDGNLIPVKYPDQQSLETFSHYDRERDIVIKNTRALLEGKKASNVLLYGDAGTGKSSTVKAIVNYFKGDGLRLIEVKKHQLHNLPDIFEQLAGMPLKIIVFIDDLSFSENDDNFTALKALLEGSAYSITGNIAIYATSNRRHLVKESFSSRSGDEIHTSDTLQELTSLAARFGLKVTFDKPDKETYLSIVTQIASEYGVPVNEQLLINAEAYALRNNGRSPRAAKQFLELQKSSL
jgi:predicted AAA+ superfamily ATPase